MDKVTCHADCLSGMGYNVPCITYSDNGKIENLYRPETHNNKKRETILEMQDTYTPLSTQNTITTVITDLEHDIEQDLLNEKRKNRKNSGKYRCLLCSRTLLKIIKFSVIGILLMGGVLTCGREAGTFLSGIFPILNNILNASVNNDHSDTTDAPAFKYAYTTPDGVKIDLPVYDYNKSVESDDALGKYMNHIRNSLPPMTTEKIAEYVGKLLEPPNHAQNDNLDNTVSRLSTSTAPPSGISNAAPRSLPYNAPSSINYESSTRVPSATMLPQINYESPNNMTSPSSANYNKSFLNNSVTSTPLSNYTSSANYDKSLETTTTRDAVDNLIKKQSISQIHPTQLQNTVVNQTHNDNTRPSSEDSNNLDSKNITSSVTLPSSSLTSTIPEQTTSPTAVTLPPSSLASIIPESSTSVISQSSSSVPVSPSSTVTSPTIVTQLPTDESANLSQKRENPSTV